MPHWDEGAAWSPNRAATFKRAAMLRTLTYRTLPRALRKKRVAGCDASGSILAASVPVGGQARLKTGQSEFGILLYINETFLRVRSPLSLGT